MQGSYKTNGLPRPYYMKPTKRGSAYEKMPRQFFFTNPRKLTGYLVMLFFFGLCIHMISQELKPQADVSYELVDSDDLKPVEKHSGDVGLLVDSAKAEDKESEKADLALNKVQNSKGEYGHAVLEAPKGGMVNEAPVVGNDEDLVVDGKTKKKPGQNNAPPRGGNSVKASREDEVVSNQVAAGIKMNEAEAIKEVVSKPGQDLDKLNDPIKKEPVEDKDSSVKAILDESDNT